MDFYSGGAQIGNLRITGDDQEIRLNGGYSATENDTLRLNMENLTFPWPMLSRIRNWDWKAG